MASRYYKNRAPFGIYKHLYMHGPLCIKCPRSSIAIQKDIAIANAATLQRCTHLNLSSALMASSSSMFRPNLVVDVVDASTFSVASGTAEGVDGGSIVILHKWFLFVTLQLSHFLRAVTLYIG